ncbi:MAG: methyltransferase domain-containing protein [Halobacteriaceae archaeon]
MPDREQVRANAKYLRGVRPVDPEEIAAYVEGGAHPAVVRRILREEAHDLGVVERGDGTFVPVPEEPFRPAFDGVSRLPERYDRALAEWLAGRYGPDWHRGESGELLRETIADIKERYYRQRAVEYDADAAAAYAVYHLADYYAAVQYVLDELGRDGLLGHGLRVLDVGAGVGGPALGLHDYLSAGRCCEEHRALVDYHAVEPAAGADVLETLFDETGPNFHATVHRETAGAFDPDGEFDLVVFASVLSELEAPADTVERYLGALADDGTAVLLAPADRNTSVGLRAVERDLVDDRGAASVYAPTLRLWPGERPTDTGWSFDRRPDVAVPAVQAKLAEGAPDPAAVKNTSVRFSYALLRTDGRRRHDATLTRDRAAPMAEAASHVTDRVDLVAAKLSHDLSDGGNPLFRVSDGSESTDHYAVLVRETALNRRLAAARYGALLRIEGGLVLYNEDESAYNVVVDEETVVD